MAHAHQIWSFYPSAFLNLSGGYLTRYLLPATLVQLSWSRSSFLRAFERLESSLDQQPQMLQYTYHTRVSNRKKIVMLLDVATISIMDVVSLIQSPDIAVLNNAATGRNGHRDSINHYSGKTALPDDLADAKAPCSPYWVATPSIRCVLLRFLTSVAW